MILNESRFIRDRLEGRRGRGTVLPSGVNLTRNPYEDVILSSLTDHQDPRYPTLTLPLERGGNCISFSPLDKGGLRGVKDLWDKRLNLS